MESVPNYFYFDSNVCLWKEEKGAEDIIIDTINLSKTQKISLSCDQSTYDKITLNKVQFKGNFNKYYQFHTSHLSLLKSHLQKCVRREEGSLAFKTAISMILIEEDKKIVQTGLFELLRRITIIIIEDAVLNINYGTLVWFLCLISNGIYLNRFCILKILSIVREVVFSKWRDKSYKYIHLNKNDKFSEIKIEKKYLNLIFSLYMRNGFRGMHGDYLMNLKAIKLWSQRFGENSNLCHHLCVKEEETDELTESDSTPLNPKEIILPAFDQHCSNIAMELSKIIGLPVRKIESLIWIYSSSLNLRLDVIPKNNKKVIIPDANWEIIKNLFLVEAQNKKMQIFNI